MSLPGQEPGRQPVDQHERDLRDHALLLVRAGLLDPHEQQEAMVEAVALQLPDTDATILARAWLAAATKQLRAAGESWDQVTDHDQLQAALAECAANGVQVHQGVAPEALRERVESARTTHPRGVLWFAPEAVYQALEAGVLNASLRQLDGGVPAAQDPLVGAVLSCLERHGLRARWHEQQLQVATWWRRRP